MGKDDIDPAKIMPTYNSFLIMRLTEIYKAWDEDDLELSIRRCLKFVVFLPKELKEKLKSKRETIIKALNGAYRKQGVDFFTTHLVRNREARRISSLYLTPFVDEIVDWLDERGYLEEKKRKVPVGVE